MPEVPASSAIDTSVTAGARAHARAQAGSVVREMATVPARDLSPLDTDIPAGDLVWAETVPAGGYVARWLARGTRLRLSDPDGEACANLVLLNADERHERLCVADTVKVMWNAYLGPDHLLLSDQARVLASIVADTSNRHDSLCGASTRRRNERRYGAGSVESLTPAGRELLVLGAAKHGLSQRDIPASVSFFQGVHVASDGTLEFDGSAGAGKQVDLICEMDLIVLLANAPHPLDPRADYTCTPLDVRAWRVRPTREGDALFHASPEGERAFRNTEAYLIARGIA